MICEKDLASVLRDGEVVSIDLGFVDGEKLTEEELDKRLDVLSMANTDRN